MAAGTALVLGGCSTVISLSEEIPNPFPLCHLEGLDRRILEGRILVFPKPRLTCHKPLETNLAGMELFLPQPLPALPQGWGLSLSPVTHPCLTPLPAGGKRVQGVPNPLTLSPHRAVSSLRRNPGKKRKRKRRFLHR